MTTMIEVKTADLIGPALDWAVARALGYELRGGAGFHSEAWFDRHKFVCTPEKWMPSTDWGRGGPLIEKYTGMIHSSGGSAEAMVGGFWNPGEEPARETGEPFGAGSTVLIAVCRAIVAAKLGDTVSVPAELVQGGAA